MNFETRLPGNVNLNVRAVRVDDSEDLLRGVIILGCREIGKFFRGITYDFTSDSSRRALFVSSELYFSGLVKDLNENFNRSLYGSDLEKLSQYRVADEEFDRIPVGELGLSSDRKSLISSIVDASVERLPFYIPHLQERVFISSDKLCNREIRPIPHFLYDQITYSQTHEYLKLSDRERRRLKLTKTPNDTNVERVDSIEEVL